MSHLRTDLPFYSDCILATGIEAGIIILFCHVLPSFEDHSDLDGLFGVSQQLLGVKLS